MTKEEVAKYADYATDFNYKLEYDDIILYGYFSATLTTDKAINKWNFVTLQQIDNKKDPIMINGNLIKSIERI